MEFPPTTPPEGIITRLNKDGKTRVAITPANVLQVKQLLREATAEGVELEEVVQKVSKAACFAMAERTIQSATTNELLELSKRKERKANRAKGNWGNARVMDQDVMDQRKKDAAEKFAEKNAEKALKEWNKEEKRLRALGPNIFAPQRPATPRRRAPAPAPATELSPPHFSSAKTSARELTPPGDSSAETTQKSSDIASKGDYSGATAGSLGAAERKAGELRGASKSINEKRTTCQKASSGWSIDRELFGVK